MNQEKQYIEFWKFIGILHQADLLRHLILIGSWAEYIYAQSGILPGYDANLRTLDVDFLIQNRNQPRQEKSIVSLAKDNGYTVAYDVMYGTTKIFTSDFMEIEFIIEQKGRGNLPVLNTNLGVRAQALRNMALLKRVAIEISIFGYDIIVPKPEAYVLHKIIINQQRGDKAEKDKETIINLMRFIRKAEVQSIIETLTKKERKVIEEFFAENDYFQ